MHKFNFWLNLWSEKKLSPSRLPLAFVFCAKEIRGQMIGSMEEDNETLKTFAKN